MRIIINELLPYAIVFFAGWILFSAIGWFFRKTVWRGHEEMKLQKGIKDSAKWGIKS
jgi:hypothetical protein